MAMDKPIQNEIKPDETLPSVTPATLDASHLPTDAGNQNVNPDIIGKYFTVRASGDITLGDYAGGQGIFWDQSADTLTILGGLSVSSLNIPDSTTTNSFHVDSSGNSWWGANVATGSAGAPAYVLNTGAALFKNITVGGSTIQYIANDQGMHTYGNAEDGSVTFDGTTDYNTFSTHAGANYTLTRDVYLENCFINININVFPAGYRIFCRTKLTVTGLIDASGGNGAIGTAGSAGSGNTGGAAGTGGVGGTAAAAGYLAGGQVGKQGGGGGKGDDAGGAGGAVGGDSQVGASIINSLGVQPGQTGPSAGAGGFTTLHNPGRAGGISNSGGTNTVRIIAPNLLFHINTMMDINADNTMGRYTASPGSSSAAGGGGGRCDAGTNAGGGGGGGGGSGGAGALIALYARVIQIDATGIISSNGGNGANGGNGGNGQAGSSFSAGGGGGSGGSGGNGGVIFLVYNTLTNNGQINVNGGTGGTKGTGGAIGGGTNPTAGINGTDGAAGSNGTIIQKNFAM